MVKFRAALLLMLLMCIGCQSQSPLAVGSDWIETQMFFGLTRPGGERISDADWQDFVDHTVTPAFPDGLTILRGDGQYRGDDGAVHQEPSAILVLLHPPGVDSKLNGIAREYDRRFGQESVLRADLPAKASFIPVAK